MKNLESALPSSLYNLYGKNALIDDTQAHAPSSPSYSGPYVAYTVSDPDKAIWKDWFVLLDDYSDARSGSLAAKRDVKGDYRGGGYDLRQYWEMEVRAAVEGLGIDPLE